MLPAAAEDARLPLPRVNGLIEMGTVLAVVGGMVLGGSLYGLSWPALASSLGGDPSAGWAAGLAAHGLPVAVAAALGLSLVGLLAAVPARFPSDVWRPEPPGRAVAGFFRDSGRILRHPKTRGSLLALAAFRGLVVAVPGAVIADTLSREAANPQVDYFWYLIQVVLWTMGGAAVGSLLAGVQGHPVRALGMVPFGVAGMAMALVLAAAHTVTWWVCLAVGVMGGFVAVPLAATYQGSVPADARGNAMSALNTAGYIFMTGMSLLIAGLARSQVLTAAGQLWFLAVLTAGAAVLAWWALFRESVELMGEILIWPVYRIRARGPGLEKFPPNGPVLVIGNHSSWFDPLWLGKVMPRRITPMMTSVFYDLPVLRWLMKRVIHAIRVQSSTYRREAPELKEAIEALDRGECVLIFPEGYMRRRTEQPLRQFGQGVWHILRERPGTPVVACWIEGGWGSYASYFGGPPLVNKRPDWWRRIEVAVGEPHLLDPSLLDDHRATRAYLMRACLAARRYLTAEPLPAGEPSLTGEEEEP
jgi:1-acyl-sn-glycerol-3-phosphate acyltransferase